MGRSVIRHSAEFFKAVTLECSSGKESMVALHEDVVRTLGTWHPGEFQPHVSLVYGDLPDETRQRVVDEVGDVGIHPIRVSAIGLFDTGGLEPSKWAPSSPAFALLGLPSSVAFDA
jgi:hypothetical protein